MADWEIFLGYCMNKGLGDPRDMYIDQFCALVWFLAVRDKEPGEVEMARAELWIPPRGLEVEIDERSPWHPDNQLKALQRAKAGPR